MGGVRERRERVCIPMAVMRCSMSWLSKFNHCCNPTPGRSARLIFRMLNESAAISNSEAASADDFLPVSPQPKNPQPESH